MTRYLEYCSGTIYGAAAISQKDNIETTQEMVYNGRKPIFPANPAQGITRNIPHNVVNAVESMENDSFPPREIK